MVLNRGLNKKKIKPRKIFRRGNYVVLLLNPTQRVNYKNSLLTFYLTQVLN